ncbi:MAG: hypothetical protein F6K35_47765 [Okeania sp. SIO2H7]|nr:hypothetical protein [Okeania sp. SIO2H7]
MSLSICLYDVLLLSVRLYDVVWTHDPPSLPIACFFVKGFSQFIFGWGRSLFLGINKRLTIIRMIKSQ